MPSHSGDGVYELHGHEWFCSYPPCEAFLELAQAPGGTRWTASAASDSDSSAGWCAEHREHGLEELMRRGVDNRGIGLAVALGDNRGALRDAAREVELADAFGEPGRAFPMSCCLKILCCGCSLGCTRGSTASTGRLPGEGLVKPITNHPGVCELRVAADRRPQDPGRAVTTSGCPTAGSTSLAPVGCGIPPPRWWPRSFPRRRVAEVVVLRHAQCRRGRDRRPVRADRHLDDDARKPRSAGRAEEGPRSGQPGWRCLRSQMRSTTVPREWRETC